LGFRRLTKFQIAFLTPALLPIAPYAGAGHFFSLLRQRKEAKKGDCGQQDGEFVVKMLL